MNKKDFFLLTALILFYLALLFITKRHVFNYQFSQKTVDNYLHSQNIFGEVKNRIFVSDETIYLASGYLYVKGFNPTQYNFEHPALLKYMFGYSILLFNNPYFLQMVFGVLFICLTYCLSKHLTDNMPAAFLSAFLLVIDPLFINMSSEALLDLGQSVLILLYVLIAITRPKLYLLQGLVLGLLISSKFWASGVYFVVIMLIYQIVKNKGISWQKYLITSAIASIIYMLTYFKAFIDSGWKFNFVFFQLKMLKYWLQHNITSYFGASGILYLTGYFKAWWGNQQLCRSTWSILWPISFFIALYNIKQNISLQNKILMSILPLGYIIYLGVQAPFARYFLPVMPFFYIGVAFWLINRMR